MTSKPIAELMHEHEIILLVVRGLGRWAEALRRERDIDVSTLRDAVTFMRMFADKCHHGKEEELLFPALLSSGLPAQRGPVQVLQAEHAQARECVGRLAAAIDRYVEGDRTASAAMIDAIGCLGSLYPQHIEKENNVLFPLSDHLLSPETLSSLEDQFAAVERSIGEDTHHRWARFAHQLETMELA